MQCKSFEYIVAMGLTAISCSLHHFEEVYGIKRVEVLDVEPVVVEPCHKKKGLTHVLASDIRFISQDSFIQRRKLSPKVVYRDYGFFSVFVQPYTVWFKFNESYEKWYFSLLACSLS